MLQRSERENGHKVVSLTFITVHASQGQLIGLIYVDEHTIEDCASSTGLDCITVISAFPMMILSFIHYSCIHSYNMNAHYIKSIFHKNRNRLKDI